MGYMCCISMLATVLHIFDQLPQHGQHQHVGHMQMLSRRCVFWRQQVGLYEIYSQTGTQSPCSMLTDISHMGRQSCPHLWLYGHLSQHGLHQHVGYVQQSLRKHVLRHQHAEFYEIYGGLGCPLTSYAYVSYRRPRSCIHLWLSSHLSQHGLYQHVGYAPAISRQGAFRRQHVGLYEIYLDTSTQSTSSEFSYMSHMSSHSSAHLWLSGICPSMDGISMLATCR